MSRTGTLFTVTTFGESHGAGVGCVVENCPPGLALAETDIQPALDRRKPGQSILTTSRAEEDVVEILSGVADGKTTGTPIALLIRNKTQRVQDYEDLKKIPRPGHADYTYVQKYSGHVAQSGGGRASARETAARVAAGAIAEKWLHEQYGVTITAWVSSVGPVDLPADLESAYRESPPSRDEVELNGTVTLDDGHDGAKGLENSNSKCFTRCPDPATAETIAKYISLEWWKSLVVFLQMKRENDSAGGIVTCVIRGCPIGLGEPVFDKLEAELAKAMLSLPATKGFEIGEGFGAARMRGSQHNDRFMCWEWTDNKVLLKTATNHAGGILGGISSGGDIYFRVAFKPVSSIGQTQETAGYDGAMNDLKVRGRHDPCVLPRCPPLVEAAAALVLADASLKQRARLAGNPPTL